MKKIFLIVLFTTISFFSTAKLLYRCNGLMMGPKWLNETNVVFMTGFEVLENLPENELSIVESNKYAMVLLDNEISIVLLYGNYDSNCRHVFTKSCLPDLGNSTIYGRELSTGMNVAIFPSNF